MTARSTAYLEVIRSTLHAVDESLTPAEQDRVYTALLAHIRARRPESVSPLGVLPAPSGPIRDPREGQS